MKKIIFIFTLIFLASTLAFAVNAYDSDYSEEYDVSACLLGSLAVGVVTGLIVTGVMWAKLKSVRYKRDAADYIKRGSMKLLRSGDFFLYSNVTRTPRPKNNSSRK